MDREDIIRMALEAGAKPSHNPDKWDILEIRDTDLERFAALVAAHERDTEAAKWAKGAKISVPTRVMEQQFSTYYRRGYEAGVLVNKEKNGG